jgi:hypothetical protein
MISVDVELALVGLAAMLEPATLISSLLALILGNRPLRTGVLFYLGGIGLTLAIGVAAAFVLGKCSGGSALGTQDVGHRLRLHRRAFDSRLRGLDDCADAGSR